MDSKNKSSLIPGLLIVLLGIILLANNFGMNIDLGEIISTYWPLILIIWALNNIVTQNKSTGKHKNIILPFLLLLIGILILGRNLGFYYFNLSMFWKILWPALLIFLGFNILKGGIRTGSTGWAVMSGIERKNKGWQLKNKSYIAFMGGIDLDLSTADISTGETYLDLTAVMGGIEIKIPDDINVICTGSGFLGGIEFLQEDTGGIIFNRHFEHKNDNINKNIVINCRAVMGGIDIKTVRM